MKCDQALSVNALAARVLRRKHADQLRSDDLSRTSYSHLPCGLRSPRRRPHCQHGSYGYHSHHGCCSHPMQPGLRIARTFSPRILAAESPRRAPRQRHGAQRAESSLRGPGAGQPLRPNCGFPDAHARALLGPLARSRGCRRMLGQPRRVLAKGSERAHHEWPYLFVKT